MELITLWTSPAGPIKINNVIEAIRIQEIAKNKKYTRQYKNLLKLWYYYKNNTMSFIRGENWTL